MVWYGMGWVGTRWDQMGSKDGDWRECRGVEGSGGEWMGVEGSGRRSMLVCVAFCKTAVLSVVDRYLFFYPQGRRACRMHACFRFGGLMSE